MAAEMEEQREQEPRQGGEEKGEGDDPKPLLLLIDTMGLMFRSHYAFQRSPVTRKVDGQHVSALFGFCRSLVRTLPKYRPTHLVLALDSKGPTFRHEASSNYKANRSPCPDDLEWQLQQLPRLASALGVMAVASSGFEADDIIGTLARGASASGAETLIMSADKDMLQLVNSNTSVLRVGNKGAHKLYREEEVLSEFGVSASQYADFLALVGDPADNITGAPGIGKVTAKRLLSEYGSIDQIVEAARLPGFKTQRLAQLICDNVDLIEESRLLTKLRSNLSTVPSWKEAVFRGPSPEEFPSLILEYGIPSLLRPMLKLQREVAQYNSRFIASSTSPTPEPITVQDPTTLHTVVDSIPNTSSHFTRSRISRNLYDEDEAWLARASSNRSPSVDSEGTQWSKPRHSSPKPSSVSSLLDWGAMPLSPSGHTVAPSPSPRIGVSSAHQQSPELNRQASVKEVASFSRRHQNAELWTYKPLGKLSGKTSE